jgi:hypothetical protein
VDKATPGSSAIAVARTAGKRIPVADLRPEFEQYVGRRHPLDLQSVLRELVAEERLVGERGVLKVPRMLVLLVHVADAGEEAPELRHDSIGERGHEAIRFFDRDRIVGRQRDGKTAREQVVDARGEIDLRFAQAKAAPPGTRFLAELDIVERVLCRILFQVLVITLQDDGDAGIERGQHAR